MYRRWIHIALDRQELTLHSDDEIMRRYPISTATKGAGEQMNSEQTPRGRHEIRSKVGAGAPRGSVFVGRRPTGEIFTPELMSREPDRDWILSRILWLRGMESGRNRLGNVDTMRRFIYIHGTPYEDRIGTPCSHGCIRMRNDDVIELFDLVEQRLRVEIMG